MPCILCKFGQNHPAHRTIVGGESESWCMNCGALRNMALENAQRCPMGCITGPVFSHHPYEENEPLPSLKILADLVLDMKTATPYASKVKAYARFALGQGSNPLITKVAGENEGAISHTEELFPLNIDQMIQRACDEKTFVEGLAILAIWETERAVEQAKQNINKPFSMHTRAWDTCFAHLFNLYFRAWVAQKIVNSRVRGIIFRMFGVINS